jgi:hypothetical protein
LILVALLGGLLGGAVIAGAAEETVHGDLGEWACRWLVTDTRRASSLPGAGGVAARAFEAATLSDPGLFYSLWSCDSNRPPDRVKSCFETWGSLSKYYRCVVGEEAVIRHGVSNAMCCAVSIVPVDLLPERPNRGTNSPLAPKAEIVFAEPVAGAWRVLPNVVDQRLAEALSSRASRILYQPASNFTKEGILQQEHKFHTYLIDQMKQNGAAPDRIMSQQERFRVEESGVRMDHWNTWTNYYRPVVLNPPLEFERGDPQPYNFRDPISAFRSYERAIFVGDSTTLLKHADPSGKGYLREIGVDYDSSRTSYTMTDRLTHVTILLTATTVFNAKTYALIFWRAQNAQDPRHGPIALQSTMLVKDDDNYFLTRDLHGAYFGQLPEASHATGGVWKYAEFERVMRQSEFPTNFYDIH